MSMPSAPIPDTDLPHMIVPGDGMLQRGYVHTVELLSYHGVMGKLDGKMMVNVSLSIICWEKPYGMILRVNFFGSED